MTWAPDGRAFVAEKGGRVRLVASGAGGTKPWPNVVRDVNGKLRLVVRGAAGAGSTRAVLGFQRPK